MIITKSKFLSILLIGILATALVTISTNFATASQFFEAFGGGTSSDGSIQFSATKIVGKTSGTWNTLINTVNGQEFLQGQIDGGHINQNNFRLTGNAQDSTGVTISGRCGDTTIMFVANNGQRGTFVGNVFCDLNKE